MAWAVRAGEGVLAQEAKRAIFQGAQTHCANGALQVPPCVFGSWLKSSSLEANYPEILVQPAGCFFHFLPLTGQSPVCEWWGRGGGGAEDQCQDCSRKILRYCQAGNLREAT